MRGYAIDGCGRERVGYERFFPSEVHVRDASAKMGTKSLRLSLSALPRSRSLGVYRGPKKAGHSPGAAEIEVARRGSFWAAIVDELGKARG